MKFLALVVALFSAAAVYVAHASGHGVVYLLAAFSFLAAVVTFMAAENTSTFIRILIRFFATETVILGTCVCVSALGRWPAALEGIRVPSSVAITVALFCVLAYVAAYIPVARRALDIADRYFRTAGTMRVPLLGFRVSERRAAAGALMFLVAINQLQVFMVVNISFVSRTLFNSLQSGDPPAFWHAVLVDYPIYLVPYLVSLYIEFVVSNTLFIRWREFLTEDYSGRWLDRHNHYGMMLAGVGTDNPDQRIQEDVPRFINGGMFGGLGIYNFSINLIAQLSSLVAYSIILWTASQKLTFPGTGFHMPGFLFWCALAFAMLGTGGTMGIGRKLATLAFARQHYEANYRFSLARLREYSEQIALLFGEKTERGILSERFVSIIRNFFSIVIVKANLSVFQNFFESISNYVPLIILAPFFFAKIVTLGDMTLTLQAFGMVNSALTFFITYYDNLADFRSVLARLTTFDASLAAGAPVPEVAHPVEPTRDFVLSGVSLDLPDGSPLLKPFDLRLAANENVLVVGPSGSGKSTLFRAISGVWPYGDGKVAAPAGAKVMVLPQKPYLPVGTLAAAVSYPEPAGTFDEATLKKVLTEVGLEKLTDKLGLDDNWTQRLSGGEQQRLAIARAILAQPDWLLLDEATSAMDVDLERRTYETIARLLPKATVVSIAHRPSLVDHHDRVLTMEPTADGLFTPREKTKVAAE
ncbi:ABC transporter [Beijerinckiaceae bacterium RH AL1]|nr:ABC transporter ATP-binding protein/permease [Beijerinckiaceae bacterium]VVB42969.1 ABC transporter [Beijerinckiaceae bacterium RH AL8]VVB42982.1 ABC transporter [Beijerinckiaceae bacterium RH CH11]VVC53599.1 ABC transporter [Beijerinckiaceae bacterium RH AL1]